MNYVTQNECKAIKNNMSGQIREARKYIHDVDTRLSGRADRLEAKLWALIGICLTTAGGVITMLIMQLIRS